MPYSITTKDGITINNIPDDVPPDSQQLKDKVADIRQQSQSTSQQSDTPLLDSLQPAIETVKGIPSAAGFIASSLPARIASGITGLAVAQQEGAQAGAEEVAKRQEALTIQPNEAGQSILESIGGGLEKILDIPGVDKIIEQSKSAGEFITNVGERFGAAAADPFNLIQREIDPSVPLSDAAKTGEAVGGSIGEGLPQALIEGALLKGTLSTAGKQVLKQSIATTSRQTGAKALLAEAAPSVESLEKASRTIYAELDDIGVLIKPKAFETLNNNISSSIRRLGFNRKIQPKIAGVLEELNKAQGAPLKVTDIEVLRRVASGAAKSLEPSEQAMAVSVIEKVDDFLGNLSPSQAVGVKAKDVGTKLKDARNLWSRARKSELITEALSKAELQASGLENGIRVQFRQILGSKKKLKGFTDEEIASMRKVVKGGKPVNILKALGGFALTEGQRTNLLRSSLGAGAGAGALGPGGLVVLPTIGTISVRLAEKITGGSAKYSDALVRAGKDGTKIVKAYMANTPKAQRSIQDLTELLLRPSTNLKNIKAATPIIQDAVYIANNFTAEQVFSALGLTINSAQEDQ